ncbi:damage-inducible protein DinB [Sphingobacterium sp. DN00404]|uniref:Damage-inducible protein DinB n=1 Tax=Sphingobacterium micropteri TaxID=2763501 RepID=A0ABR7YUA5_9SPHI|nr:DinB family protein [Sphingobacterium micropteri]MBD1434905.1 damage-inducible protein DinB [Sphingobacterium micropteri]
MVQFFKELFDYNLECNQILAQAIVSQQEQLPEKVISLYSHILNAHQIWNNRIDPKAKTFGVWQVHDTGEFISLDLTNYRHSSSIIESTDLNQTINYKNSTGQHFTSTIRDIIFHIINHSTYHRAQIATEFRQSNLDPLMTDYIMFKR